MATPQDEHIPAGQVEGFEKMSEKQANDSEVSSATNTENVARAEGVADAFPQTSRHPRFGNNQVFVNENVTADLPNVEKAGTYDRIELTEEMCYGELGFSFPSWKKW